MNLRTSLQLSAVFPIVLAILVSLSLVLRSRQVDKSQRVFRSVENLTRAAAELHVATYACLLRQDSMALETWKAKRGAMVAALNAIDTESAVGRIVLDRSKDGVRNLEVTFVEFAGTPGTSAKPDSPIGVQILTDSDALVRNAFELARMADSDAEETRANADMFFAVFIGIMGLLMAAATLSIGRDVVNRLGRLQEWTRRITDGKLDTKIDTGGRNDEVGQLARAFSDMTGRVGTAYETMEKEIVENKRVADALRESNVLLSNALEKLKRAQHQIIQQERLHVLEQVVRGVSHDFNNTLTPILGMSDFMLADPKTLANTEKVIENLKEIREAAYRARKDVKKLSEFFRPTKGRGFQAVDLNELVNLAIPMTAPRWQNLGRLEKGPIGVQTELGQVPAVAGDRAELKEVLTNLLMNAVEAMPKGGQITISTRLDGPNAVLEVKDTGEGMTDDDYDMAMMELEDAIKQEEEKEGINE
jgi:signal transduction histidine kinase